MKILTAILIRQLMYYMVESLERAPITSLGKEPHRSSGYSKSLIASIIAKRQERLLSRQLPVQGCRDLLFGVGSHASIGCPFLGEAV